MVRTEDERGCPWIKNLTEAMNERDWPRLVLWDFIGACAIAALLAAALVLAS